MMNHTKSVEDYLEAILMIQEEKGFCRSIDVATHLGFSKPSVSIAMKNLQQDGCVTRGPDGALLLTDKGHEIASATLERHRFLTAFFIDIGVPPQVAEDDACGMEHSVSKETFDRFRAWYCDLKASGAE